MSSNLSEILLAYTEGKTWAEIISKFKISKYQLQKVIKKSGIKRPRPNSKVGTKYNQIVDDRKTSDDQQAKIKQEQNEYIARCEQEGYEVDRAKLQKIRDKYL